MYVPVSSYVIVHWFLKIRDWLVLCTSWSCISVHNIGQRCRSTLITLTWPAHLAPCAGPGHTWSTFIHTNTIRKTPVQIVATSQNHVSEMFYIFSNRCCSRRCIQVHTKHNTKWIKHIRQCCDPNSNRILQITTTSTRGKSCFLITRVKRRMKKAFTST